MPAAEHPNLCIMCIVLCYMFFKVEMIGLSPRPEKCLSAGRVHMTCLLGARCNSNIMIQMKRGYWGAILDLRNIRMGFGIIRKRQLCHSSLLVNVLEQAHWRVCVVAYFCLEIKRKGQKVFHVVSIYRISLGQKGRIWLTTQSSICRILTMLIPG